MPRFIARLRIKRRYTHWFTRPAESHSHEQLIAEACALPKPAPWAEDWRLTVIEDPRLVLPAEITKGDWGLRVECPVTAEASIVIHAKSEAAARAHIQKNMIDSYYHIGPADTSVPNWCGYRDRGQIELTSLRRDPAAVRLRRSFEIPIDTLVCDDRSWYPYENDQIFEVFRWMVASGESYEKKCTWHTQSMAHIFSGRQGTDPFGFGHKVRPILSIRDLKRRFQHVLLSQSYDFYQDWRDDHNFHLGSTLRLEVAHYGKRWRDAVGGPTHWHDRQNFTFDRLIGNLTEDLSGMTMAHSLNTSHPRAKTIQRAGISVTPGGFAFIICYGYPKDGSSWEHTLARTRGNEPFVETADRAHRLMQKLIPDFHEQQQAKRETSWKLRELRNDDLARLAVQYQDQLSAILADIPKAA